MGYWMGLRLRPGHFQSSEAEKWCGHGWCISTGEAGHKDWGEQILWL